MERRVIMHIDMNSYFASVEQQANPFLRGKPIGVGGPNEGRTVVAAASIEAKQRGVKAGMSIHEVRRLCPDFIFVQGDYHKYAHVTDRVLRIFRRYTPILEIFSIDEAFLDVTGTLRTFDNAIKAALDIKKSIRREVGECLTCSVGIAPNKLLAKLASDKKKPDGLVVVRSKDVPEFLRRTALDELCGIGSRIKRRLLGMGIDTLDKLGAVSPEVLIRRFGKYGLFLSNVGRGEDDAPVLPYYEIPDPKSMGHTYTLPRDTSDRGIIFSTLLRLSEQVGRRLRSEHFLGRTVSALLRKSDFTSLHRQRALKKWIDDGYEIYIIARDIIESFHYYGPVRLVGVSVSGLVKDIYQMPLFPEDIDRERLTCAADAINNRYGEFTVGRASLMLADVKKGASGLGVNRAMSRSHKYEDCLLYTSPSPRDS
mgnify:CR=1 FL=1